MVVKKVNSEAARSTFLSGVRGIISAVAVASLLLVFPSLLRAASPLAAVTNASSPSATSAEGGSWDAGKIRAALKEAESDLWQFESNAINLGAATTDILPEDIEKRRYYLKETVESYKQQLINLERLERSSQQLSITRQQVESWPGFDSPPPYSVVFVDLLAQEAQSAEDKLKALSARRDTVREVREQLTGTLRTDAGSERLQAEKSQRSASSVTGAEAWAVEQSRVGLRALSARSRSLAIVDQLFEIEIAATKLAIQLANKKLESAGSNVVFPEADYLKIQESLANERRRTERSSSLIMESGKKAVLELENLNEKIAAITAEELSRGADPVVIKEKIRPYQNAAEIAQLRSKASESLTLSFRVLPAALEAKLSAWNYRYRFRQAHSPEFVSEAKQVYKKNAAELALYARYFDQQADSLTAEIAGLKDRSQGALEPAQQAIISGQLAVQLDREQQLREGLKLLSSAQSVVARLGDDLGAGRTERSVTDQLAVATVSAKDAAMSVWNYELFAAEQTIDVDGRKVTGVSSVTIGKVTRAILIFSFGVLLALWLGRIAERLLVSRMSYDAMRARILRKWILALTLVILLVSVLTWVNIPLTIFAFLGGAIAIGIGFGMQNVLKNLISGLMLLFERPFQPGDLVEVGGLRGTVTEIGIRSSIIRSVDGIDTLIPNNTFVEQNVTNWVLENPRVRFKIAIGVAYGSDVREVARLLNECTERHKLVLKEPAPEVLFEDFGADALNFGLFYWVAIGGNVSGARVASDLRFIIEKSMSKNGIVIAYPQRDVHLDSSKPLKIEVVGDRLSPSNDEALV
jgi:small-conductance mechanosensitive channel